MAQTDLCLLPRLALLIRYAVCLMTAAHVGLELDGWELLTRCTVGTTKPHPEMILIRRPQSLRALGADTRRPGPGPCNVLKRSIEERKGGGGEGERKGGGGERKGGGGEKGGWGREKGGWGREEERKGGGRREEERKGGGVERKTDRENREREGSLVKRSSHHNATSCINKG